MARKSDFSDAEARDVLQEVLLSVARMIAAFERNAKRGAFKIRQ